MESLVEKALGGLLTADAPFDCAMVKKICAPAPAKVPVIAIGTPDLSIYDSLLTERAA